ncbi:MAG: hypothetical protein H7A24_09930 [Leptospiraceae bacterium]|nr:hypothetical protein [Leptospiraceae bacterium]MCP5512188.1 hypothetical protein [Leptospiraceae bacterium]
MNQLPGEEILKSWFNGALVLTNYKVYTNYENKIEGKVKGSIMLDQVCMIKVSSKSKMIFLILAGLSALLGLYKLVGDSYGEKPYGMVFGMLLLAAIFVALYLHTRKNYLAVTSAGGNIEFQVQGNAEQLGNEFLSSVEEARYNLFYKNSKPSAGQ